MILGSHAHHLPAASAAKVDWSHAQFVTVQLVDDRFIPDVLRFRHGVPYHLHLENNGTSMHEFTAPEFFGAINVKSGDVLEPDHNELLLQPNEQKDLYFVAPGPGHYGLTCADHDWDGMTGEIIVE